MIINQKLQGIFALQFLVKEDDTDKRNQNYNLQFEEVLA